MSEAVDIVPPGEVEAVIGSMDAFPKPSEDFVRQLRTVKHFDYDQSRYPFAEAIGDVFGGAELTQLHKQQAGSDTLPLLSMDWDQKVSFL